MHNNMLQNQLMLYIFVVTLKSADEVTGYFILVDYLHC